MKYPLFKIKINNKKSLDLIKNVFKSGFINEGSEVKKLTQILSNKISSKNCCFFLLQRKKLIFFKSIVVNLTC